LSNKKAFYDKEYYTFNKYDNQRIQFSHTIVHFIIMLIEIQDGFEDFKMFTVVALLFLILSLTLLTSSLFKCSDKVPSPRLSNNFSKICDG